MSNQDWPSGRSCGTRIADQALDELVEWQRRTAAAEDEASALRCALAAAHRAATEHYAPILDEHGEHLDLSYRIAVLGRAAENRRVEIARLRAELDAQRKLVAEMDRQRVQMGESLLRSAETGAVLAAALEPGRGPWG